jgi:2-oxoglutarate ferredoxin oxidoreductase subunit beta
MALAQTYGRDLYTGVLYRNPKPPPTYETLVRERQQKMAGQSGSRERVLDLFVPQ